MVDIIEEYNLVKQTPNSDAKTCETYNANTRG